MPNVDDIHSHITGMLDGKLGRLAKEIAEETASDINLNMEEGANVQDVLSGLIKNPTKLMGLVKNVGEKLDSKMKSGEIKESELISEASDLMNKMKNMQGMEEIQSMLRKMGMNGKLNTSAMQAHLDRSMKMAKTKERMKAKVEANKLVKEKESKQDISSNVKPQYTEEDILKLFSNEEKETPVNKTKSKKKKNKKKIN